VARPLHLPWFDSPSEAAAATARTVAAVRAVVNRARPLPSAPLPVSARHRSRPLLSPALAHGLDRPRNVSDYARMVRICL